MTTPQSQPNGELTFTTSDARIQDLLERMREVADLGAIGALLSWDQNTELPEGAGEVRGAQMATFQGILHERMIATRIGELLGELESVVANAPYTDADRGLVRQTRREYDHATKLPTGLVQEIARTESAAFEAWRRARANNDFALFAPWLGKTITLQREVADRLSAPGQVSRYDALLDLYEPGMTSERLDALFGPVREVCVEMLRRIQQSGHTIDASCLEGDFPADSQVALARELLTGIGYDFTRGAIAVSPHPFTSSFGTPYDVRVTVRPDPHFLQAALMAAVHEGGHAVYEQGSDTRLARTPLAGGASLGAHESQSRLWENAIGRSEAYWKGQYDKVKAAYPEQLASVDAVTFARALNTVKPSLIRVEADEVTYNLHIIVRYEMEKAMVNGDVAVESLPGAWNGMYQEYLGIEPPTNSEGILQDIHWTSGFGYFPTYTLGNLYAAQIYATLRKTFPDLDERLASGDTRFILDWLRERMYSVGAVYLPERLMERVTGEKPNPDYFRRYLTEKFTKVYDLTA
ncbi:MAG TPA: carboxypeptidase M32, partial [Ktedonobacterales bacterium]